MAATQSYSTTTPHTNLSYTKEYYVLVELMYVRGHDNPPDVATYGAFTSKADAQKFLDQMEKKWGGIDLMEFAVVKVQSPTAGLQA